MYHSTLGVIVITKKKTFDLVLRGQVERKSVRVALLLAGFGFRVWS